MAQCARCSVARIMKKYGDSNVIELEKETQVFSGIEYQIYRRVNHQEKSGLTLEGEHYRWVMSCYSNNHSLDEDCDLNAPSQIYGFPQKKLLSEEGNSL